MSYTSACPSCGKVRTLTRPPEKEGQRCSGCANRRYPDGQTCAEHGCETTEGLRRGLCSPHYMQAWTAANPRPKKPIDWEARSWENYWRQVEKTDNCWIWTGHKSPKGYGRVGFLNRFRPAHRIPWEALNGPVPEGLELDHLCRVRHCVNPAHLEAVTHRENMLRSVAARFGGVRAVNGEIVGSGESHPWRRDAIAAAERHHPRLPEPEA